MRRGYGMRPFRKHAITSTSIKGDEHARFYLIYYLRFNSANIIGVLLQQSLHPSTLIALTSCRGDPTRGGLDPSPHRGNNNNDDRKRVCQFAPNAYSRSGNGKPAPLGGKEASRSAQSSRVRRTCGSQCAPTKVVPGTCQPIRLGCCMQEHLV